MPIPVRRRPTMDWACEHVLDAMVGDSDAMAACEVCGTRIRWVHVLSHVDYHRPIEVGGCCAERLCCDYDAAGAERKMKSRVGRRERFLDRGKWKRSRRNPDNLWRLARTPQNGTVTVTVFVRDDRFCVYLAAGKDDRWCDGENFETQRGAMQYAFDLIEKLRCGEGVSDA